MEVRDTPVQLTGSLRFLADLLEQTHPASHQLRTEELRQVELISGTRELEVSSKTQVFVFEGAVEEAMTPMGVCGSAVQEGSAPWIAVTKQ